MSGNHGSDVPAWTASRWFDGLRGVLLLITLCLTVYLPGFTGIPVVDRDEARFAQASRGMLESGDYVIPRILETPRLNKPPLIYWLQSTAANALTRGRPIDDAIWMYRVPSLLAGLVTVLAIRRLGTAMYSPFVGFLGAAMVAVAPVFFWEAHQARADMVMVACTTLGMLGLWRCLNEPEEDAAVARPWPRALARSVSPSPAPLLLWLAVAAGIMTKGPVTPMVLGMGAFIWALATRRWSRLIDTRPLFGVGVVLAACLPWVALVAQRVGLSHYLNIINEETVGRSLSPKEGHSGFPGLHTLLMPALFFPGCLLVGVGIRNAFASSSDAVQPGSDEGNRASSPPQRLWIDRLRQPFSPTPGLFLLCILVPSWLIFEAIGTRLPHYTMPLYPALALLTARACAVSAGTFAALFTRAIVRWALTLWLVEMPIALLAGAGVLAFAFRGVTGLGLGLCGLGLTAIFLALAARALRARDLPRLQLTALVFFACTLAAVGFALPRFEELWISRGLAAQLQALDPAHRLPLAAVGNDAARAIIGFQEDSLTYETRGRVQHIDPGQLESWFTANPGGFAIIPAQMLVGEARYYPIARADGFNYSKGRLTYLCIAVRR